MAAQQISPRANADNKVRTNKDELYYQEPQESKLLFGSSLVEEWLRELREAYPKFEEETHDDRITLTSSDNASTITIYPFMKVLVHGTIMERFETEFPEMRQSVRGDNTERVPRAAELIPPSEDNDEKIKEHLDKLFYNKRRGKKNNLIFGSRRVTEWLRELRDRYPDFEKERKQKCMTLRFPNKTGTMTIYSDAKFDVRGEIMEMFETEFPEMKQRVMSEGIAQRLAGMALAERGDPDE